MFVVNLNPHMKYCKRKSLWHCFLRSYMEQGGGLEAKNILDVNTS